jgi:D-serine deaminase-like pyridoxal phosphate-dependent protein
MINAQLLVGRGIGEIPTPALVLDLDAFDRNAAQIARDLQDAGVAWRPHAKAHANPELARRQIAAGAIGVTCATVAEAEVLVGGGVQSVLIANEIVTADKAARLASLQRQAEVLCCVDSQVGVGVLRDAADAAQVTIHVVIEVDVGMRRGGVAPESVVRLGELVLAAKPWLRLAGVMGYEGQVLELNPADKEAACRAAIGSLVQAQEHLAAIAGSVDVVSCGGTGSYRFAAAIPGVTEIQAGGGCFFDRFYRDACGVTWLEPALTVHSTVTSSARDGVAIVDAGLKAMSIADGAPIALAEGAIVRELFAEHGVLEFAPGSRNLRVGDRVQFIPGYSDSTTVLHAAFVGVRAGRIESILQRPQRWPG